MADLSNDELKALLEQRLDALKSSANTEPKDIDNESVEFLLKTLALPSDFAPLAQQVFELAPRTKVVWLHLAECTGCSESFLRTAAPNLAHLLFDFISLEYHETLMIADGWQAEESLERLLASDEEFILAVEGGVAAIATHYLTIGGKGTSGFELLQSVAKRAKAVFAIGTCSCYGGIQAARPNPTQSCGISEVLAQKVVQVPGCPPSDTNIVVNLCFFALFQTTPNLDEKNRPKWAYGKCLHDMCERKAKFESGVFAECFDDALAKDGACLFKVGCKGPYAYSNCPKTKFNTKTSWSIQAGHGCIACCEPNFWDEFGFYEVPMNNANAYEDFSLRALSKDKSSANADTKGLLPFAVSESLDENGVFLSFGEKLGVLYSHNGEPCDFLAFEFESNTKLVLQNLAKNKLGAALVQNYKDKFAHNFAFIEQNYDENSSPSGDISKFFEYIFVLARGERLKSVQEFFECAASYKFKHASPFDIKLSLSDESAKLDISKAMRFPLIYLCGGLGVEGIAFSACVALLARLKETLDFVSTRQNKPISVDLRADSPIVRVHLS